MDLTRFDFHVMRFMYSESVRTMTAAEVGQYILLLSESWMTGKDCTLPTDRETLAAMARVKHLSPKVLKKFPIISTKFGKRRQNPVLFAEWQAAAARSEKATIKGKKGNEARWGVAAAIPQPSPSDDSAIAKPSPNPNQSKPYQPK